MERTKSLNFIAFIINLLNVVLVSMCVVSLYTMGGTGNMEVAGAKCFKFFTVDSNILMALASIPALIFEITNVIYNKNRMPKVIIVLKYIGTVAVLVTFLTTALFLPLMYDFFELFQGMNFYLHLYCPIFALVSLLIETQEELKFKNAFLSALPVVIYGFIYILMVKYMGTWEDFYGFDINGLGIVSYIVMIVLTFILGFAVLKLHKLFKNKIVKY